MLSSCCSMFSNVIAITRERISRWGRSLGAKGMTVDDPAALAAAFSQALATDATVVIDVKADKDCPTPVYDFTAGARAWSYHE